MASTSPASPAPNGVGRRRDRPGGTPGPAAAPSGARDAYTLVVRGGRHAGVVQHLTPGAYRIGRDLGADIVLTDPDMAPLHALVEPHGRGLRVEALEAPVGLGADGPVLRPGDERVVPFPAELALGGAFLVLRAPAPEPRRFTFLPGLMLAAAALAAALVVGLGVMRSDASVGDHVAVIDPRLDPATVTPPPVDPVRAESARLDAAADAFLAGTGDRVEASVAAPGRVELTGFMPRRSEAASLAAEVGRRVPGVRSVDNRIATPDVAAERLRARLAATPSLGGAIRVTVEGDSVVASGAVGPDAEAGWRAAHDWFDQRFGRYVVLVARVGPVFEEKGPSLAVRAVWTGPMPYIIAGDGQRYVEGAVVLDGWVIRRITADRLVLGRGGRTLTLVL